MSEELDNTFEPELDEDLFDEEFDDEELDDEEYDDDFEDDAEWSEDGSEEE